MPVLYLHCGAGHTATSFLQVLFARHRDHLASSGIFYPDDESQVAASTGRITSGNGVAMANFIRPELPHKILNKGAFLNRFRKDVAVADGRDMLYSSEMLLLGNDRAAQIRDEANARGYHVKVIYFVRSIGGMAVSSYGQQLKRSGETRSFEQFLCSWAPPFGSSIQGYCETVGQKNLVVKNYDEHSESLARLVFEGLLAVPSPPFDPVPVNRGLSHPEMVWFRYLNSVFPADRSAQLSTLASDLLMRSTSQNRSRFDLTKSEVRLIKNRHESEIRYVNKFVEGQPIVAALSAIEKREEFELTEIEKATLSVLGGLLAELHKPV